MTSQVLIAALSAKKFRYGLQRSLSQRGQFFPFLIRILSQVFDVIVQYPTKKNAGK